MKMRRLILAAATLAALATPALAIDFTQEVKQIDGQPLTDDKGNPKPTTLGELCRQALLAGYADEHDQSGKETITQEEKFHRWEVARLVKGKDVTLSVDDLALVKKLTGKAFGPLIMGPIWLMLDPTLDKGGSRAGTGSSSPAEAKAPK